MTIQEQEALLTKALDGKLVEFEGKLQEHGKKSTEDTAVEIKNLSDKFEDLQRTVKSQNLPYEKAFNDSSSEQIRKGLEGIGDRMDSYKGEYKFDVKAQVLESNSLVPNTNIQNVITSDRKSGIIVTPERKTHVRDILSIQPTNSDKWSWEYEDVYTDGTAQVVEGTTYPQSTVIVKVETKLLKKIGAIMNVSKELLTDHVGFQAFVSKRMNDKLLAKEDIILMHGSGVGDNIKGLFNYATPFVAGVTGVSNPQHYDVIAVAALQATIENYTPTAVIVNPIDLTAMALKKDTQGKYILPVIFGESVPKVMYLEVIASTYMTANNFLVGDFDTAAQMIQNQAIRFETSFENNDNFERDMVTLKISERVLVVCYLAKAFVKGTFTGVGGGLTLIA